MQELMIVIHHANHYEVLNKHQSYIYLKAILFF